MRNKYSPEMSVREVLDDWRTHYFQAIGLADEQGIPITLLQEIDFVSCLLTAQRYGGNKPFREMVSVEHKKLVHSLLAYQKSQE